MCIITIILKRYLKMTVLHENGVLVKSWYFLRTYILTLKRFDLFLQGALLITILLETNVFLLLRRDHGGGQTPAYVEDWIILGAAGTEFLVGTLVGWWGSHKRNFALSAWLGLAAISGCLVLFVPFAEERSPNVELCGGGPITLYREADLDGTGKTWRLAFLIISACICSLTKISIWAHGFTYLDDHDPQNGPYFYGILISIRMSLGLSGQNWLQPSSLGEDWWKSHLSLCCLTLMFSILFTLFPTQMKEFPDDEQERTTSGNYLPSLDRVARNKVLVLQTVALALLTTAVFGFVHYDRAFVQARFHMEAYRQDPRSSRALSDIFRALVIIFFVMIFRVRFSVRRCDGVKANTASKVGGVVAAIVAVLLAVIAALGCDLGDVAGVGEQYTQPACSMQCGCDSARYGFSPVCALETSTTYFSPCHAGCQEVRDLNGFPRFMRSNSCSLVMVTAAVAAGAPTAGDAPATEAAAGGGTPATKAAGGDAPVASAAAATRSLHASALDDGSWWPSEGGGGTFVDSAPRLFSNCTCAGAAGGPQEAVRGACSIVTCRTAFSAYQVLYTVFLAVAAAAFLMQGMVIVRAVRRVDKPVAMATSFAVIALLSSVGGHVIYMSFSYIACAYYSEGRCVLHKESLWLTACVSSVLALCSGAVSILASRARTEPAIPTTEL